MDKATPTPAAPIQVTMLAPSIWIESGIAGDRHIMVQYADDAPFEYAALYYRYGYTDNATIHRAATNIAVSIGASEPVEERLRTYAEVERLAAQSPLAQKARQDEGQKLYELCLAAGVPGLIETWAEIHRDWQATWRGIAQDMRAAAQAEPQAMPPGEWLAEARRLVDKLAYEAWLACKEDSAGRGNHVNKEWEVRTALIAHLSKQFNGDSECSRGELVTAVHTLASHFENALYALRDDAEALAKAKSDIAHAMKVAARHNYNGAGCRVIPAAGEVRNG